MTTFDDLNAMAPAALRQALSGPPAAVASLLRTAAEGGSIEAQLRLGQLLLDGADGLRAAPAEALRWFGAAAGSGSAMGMNMVGRCCEHGWGTGRDATLAARWYSAAADRGLDWGLYNLATLLALGDGVARDRPRALALFEQAAALGHAKSMNMVGSFHEDGWVVPANRDVAAEHYRRAAEGGDFRGAFNHGRFLIEDGLLDEGLDWLRRAAGTANPRFVAQMREWLERRKEPRLRAMAQSLVRQAREQDRDGLLSV